MCRERSPCPFQPVALTQADRHGHLGTGIVPLARSCRRFDITPTNLFLPFPGEITKCPNLRGGEGTLGAWMAPSLHRTSAHRHAGVSEGVASGRLPTQLICVQSQHLPRRGPRGDLPAPCAGGRGQEPPRVARGDAGSARTQIAPAASVTQPLRHLAPPSLCPSPVGRPPSPSALQSRGDRRCRH